MIEELFDIRVKNSHLYEDLFEKGGDPNGFIYYISTDVDIYDCDRSTTG